MRLIINAYDALVGQSLMLLKIEIRAVGLLLICSLQLLHPGYHLLIRDHSRLLFDRALTDDLAGLSCASLARPTRVLFF